MANKPAQSLRDELSLLNDSMGAINSLIPAGGKWYHCDPTAGTGSGLSADDATPSLLTAYNLCRDGYNDGVIFHGGATAYNPTAAFTWSKSYCHLIGISADLPGLGQRCRFVMQATPALTPAITFSGSGNVIANMQFSNEKAAGSAAGCVVVTGSRNLFKNVFFMSPTATDAASYSLKMNGSENVFEKCTIGQFTNPRTAASYGLWLYGTSTCLRNKFIDCEFLSWGYDATHVHVYVDSSITVVPWTVTFQNCLFQHNATQLTQAIDDNCTAAGHQILFRGRDSLVVNAAAVGDALTYMFAPNPDASISGLLAVTVAES